MFKDRGAENHVEEIVSEGKSFGAVQISCDDALVEAACFLERSAARINSHDLAVFFFAEIPSHVAGGASEFQHACVPRDPGQKLAVGRPRITFFWIEAIGMIVFECRTHGMVYDYSPS